MSLGARAAFTNGDLAFLQQRGMIPMAWSPLAGGHLLAEAAAPPAGVLPVLGTNSLPRIARISEALRVPMDRQTWFELYTLAQGHEVP